MYVPLQEVRLRDGETVAAAAIGAPDLEWAARIEALLGHKPPFWSWQNSAVLRRQLGLTAHFYVLHRDGDPFAHVMTVEVEGVGILGHVFTREEDRRKGAARQLLQRQAAHFRGRGGRALYLRTEFGSSPYRLYASLGFRGIEPRSRVMAWHAETVDAFSARWFAPGPTVVVAPDWPHWPASVPLFAADLPGIVRSVRRGLFGRESSEGPFLAVLRDGGQATARVLVQTRTRAVVGFAEIAPDPRWPSLSLLDVHCHPAFAARAGALLAELPLPAAGRIVAYADTGQEWKGDLLAASGFVRAAELKQWLPKDAARTDMVDVGVWTRGV